MCAALHLGGSEALAADGSSPAKLPVQTARFSIAKSSPVSDRFRRQMDTAAALVPEHVWTGLRGAGWQVRLARYVVDVAPQLKSAQPRGWPKGTTWENTDAVHMPKSRLLVIAEKRRGKQGQAIDNRRAEGVLRHEIGHAFDMVSGSKSRFLSSSSNFITAYQRDARRLGDQDRTLLAYYLQGKEAGRQETLAEAFGVILGGGSDPLHEQQFIKAFPSVIQLLRQSIDGYSPLKKARRESRK